MAVVLPYLFGDMLIENREVGEQDPFLEQAMDVRDQKPIRPLVARQQYLSCYHDLVSRCNLLFSTEVK
jgi:hypothetical protein